MGKKKMQMNLFIKEKQTYDIEKELMVQSVQSLSLVHLFATP